MTVRLGINGFGRMGRLVVHALRHQPGLELVHVNELKGGVETAAHLLEFDTVHGRFPGRGGAVTATASSSTSGRSPSASTARPVRSRGTSTAWTW